MPVEVYHQPPVPIGPPAPEFGEVRTQVTPTTESYLAQMGFWLGPEPTPAPVETPDPEDPFAESDQANTQALEDVQFGDEAALEDPRLVAVIEVRVVDVPFSDRFDQYMQVGIVATGDRPIALVRNIDDCLVDPWQAQGVMADPEEVQDGVRLALVDERIDAINAVVTIPSLPVTINGEEYNLPLVSANEVTVAGETVVCPSVGGQLGDLLGDAVSPETMETIGRGIGSALGALVEGFDQGFND